MSKKKYDDLEFMMSKFNLSDYQATICKNIKIMRKALYHENKQYYKDNGLRNPYSAESVSELLSISHEYYKRLESFDKTKPISLKLLLKIMVLFEADITDFFRK